MVPSPAVCCRREGGEVLLFAAKLCVVSAAEGRLLLAGNLFLLLGMNVESSKRVVCTGISLCWLPLRALLSRLGEGLVQVWVCIAAHAWWASWQQHMEPAADHHLECW